MVKQREIERECVCYVLRPSPVLHLLQLVTLIRDLWVERQVICGEGDLDGDLDGDIDGEIYGESG